MWVCVYVCIEDRNGPRYTTFQSPPTIIKYYFIPYHFGSGGWTYTFSEEFKWDYLNNG